MDCETIQEQLSGLLDGDLDRPTVLQVEAHLADCEQCRSQHEALLAVDSSLTRVFATDAGLADRVAERVLANLPATSTASASRRPSLPWQRALSYLIAMAAGFLLAVFLFPPGQRPVLPAGPRITGDPSASPDVEASPLVNPAATPAAIAVAHLVHTTGPISYRAPSGSEWEQIEVADFPVFGCPSDSSVRTAPGALCELETPGGSRIRLNESSEVAFVSEHELELKQGQIWCRASEDADLRVVAGDDSDALQPPPLLTFSCPTSVGCVTSSAPAQPLQVASAAGRVEVSVDGEATTLPAGIVATLANGKLELAESPSDLVHAERWMQPLLTLRGHGNPELTERVDALLARIGRTKLAWMYEQDLRNLGEYGALPLLRYVQSAPSRQDVERRHTAINVLADTAPIWLAPDLIALLEDDDPVVRVASARGLARLSGSDLGFPAEEWDADPADLAAGVAAWNQWWLQHRFACVAPPAAATPTWDQVH
jgi:ferric-dicitrate binding protein FerR (iron transport regulator)